MRADDLDAQFVALLRRKVTRAALTGALTAAIEAIGSFEDPYFSDTATGKILGTSAANLPEPQVIGIYDGDVETALMNALNEVAQKGVAPEAAWSNAAAAIDSAVG